MITFLAKLWIKDYQKTDLPEVRQAYGVLCGGVGIGFNILLFLGKFLRRASQQFHRHHRGRLQQPVRCGLLADHAGGF